MKYKIANEIILFESESESIKRRFDTYKYEESYSSDTTICLQLDAFYKFHETYNHLTEEQCKLIYSLQIFFDEMIKRNKLLIHASIVVINGLSYVFIGNSGCGKSYFTQRIMEHYSESFIFSDDRTVIGLENGELFAWNTPWSKIGINLIDGISVNYIFYINLGNIYEIKKIDTEELVINIKNLYPKECRNRVIELLHKIVKTNSCFIIKNDMNSFDIEKLRCLGIDL